MSVMTYGYVADLWVAHKCTRGGPGSGVGVGAR